MITGRTPYEVRRMLRNVMQAAVATVSNGVLRFEPGPSTQDLLLEDDVASPHGRLFLRLRHRHLLMHDSARRVDERWSALTVTYAYQLDGADGREILAYHWHPEGASHERLPHLHIGTGFGAIRPEWQKAHLRTGSVTPTALLTLLITHLGVPPHHPDWGERFGRLDHALAPT